MSASDSPGHEPGRTPSGRDHGEQPLAGLLAKHELAPRDLVAASTQQLNHKMVSRAVKGRQLTPNVMGKVIDALNAAAGSTYLAGDAFTYARTRRQDGSDSD